MSLRESLPLHQPALSTRTAESAVGAPGERATELTGIVATSEFRMPEKPPAATSPTPPASGLVQRQFETHCVIRLCNAVDDENAVTGVEVTRRITHSTK